IKKIRFRHDLSNAKSVNEQREIVGKASADAALADFAWRYDCEATVAGCTPTTTPKRDLTVKPFAENLFPKKVRHYIAIPKPGEAVQKFYETLQGLQLESPRSQASLALMLNGVRQVLGQQLNAPSGAPTLLDYTGIDTNAPIALGSWTADKAADSTAVAQRRAIILRVKDRARFERLVQQFQSSTGGFTNYVDYLAIGTRGIAALPAFLPFTAQAVASADPPSKKKPVRKSITLIGDDEWNGLRVRRFEQRQINGDGGIDNYVTYLTFLGDTAIVTSDLATLRDLFNTEGRPSLAENTEFRKAVEQRGDAIYFSDLRAVFAEASDAGKPVDFNIHESGMLNITNASWENSHHLVFDESDWTKPLLPFQPKDLSAPRDLLPASTIAYFLTKVDLKLDWIHKPKTSLLPSELDFLTVWSLNFKDEVLPELGPECGAVVLELPGMPDFEGGSWAAFCKLKS
ncbi:MAG TPA: hypothetical protein VFI71_10955, partial [Pyrinomonadaceae bacterium]|nr:hypothetical protein [Pyrinomonadaceae bacterium]